MAKAKRKTTANAAPKVYPFNVDAWIAILQAMDWIPGARRRAVGVAMTDAVLMLSALLCVALILV